LEQELDVAKKKLFLLERDLDTMRHKLDSLEEPQLGTTQMQADQLTTRLNELEKRFSCESEENGWCVVKPDERKKHSSCESEENSWCVVKPDELEKLMTDKIDRAIQGLKQELLKTEQKNLDTQKTTIEMVCKSFDARLEECLAKMTVAARFANGSVARLEKELRSFENSYVNNVEKTKNAAAKMATANEEMADATRKELAHMQWQVANLKKKVNGLEECYVFQTTMVEAMISK
jgi:predicted  nucleic acid-binding Zn-ribbon protein